MLKKYVLLGLLVMVGAWSTMAFASVTYQPKQNNAVAIIDHVPGFQQYEYGPVLLATGFAAPARAPKLEVFPQYEYGPLVLATGFASPTMAISQGFQQYEYGPALLATGFAAPAKAPKLEVFEQYQYGPAVLATGFASPAK